MSVHLGSIGHVAAEFAFDFPEDRKATALPGRGDAAQRIGKELEMKTFINMLKDDSGASAAEYALILAIVGAGIAVAAWGLGQAITGAMDNASSCIGSGGGSSAPSC